MELIYSDLTTTVEGKYVEITIAATDLRVNEPWYSQVMCSIFPSWGFIQPGIAIQSELRSILISMVRDSGIFGIMEAFQGRYTISYTVYDAPDGPDAQPLMLANSTAGISSVSPPSLPDCWPYRTCLKSGRHLVGTAYLTQGRSLVALNGNYFLTMQEDCNLVVYQGDLNNPPSTPIWASKTQGKGSDCFLRMQTDCNLVIYDNNYNVVWATMRYCPNCFKACALCMQEDGYAVVYDRVEHVSLWASN